MFSLLISRNAFFDEKDVIRPAIYELFELIRDKDIQVVLVTRSKQKYKNIIRENLPDKNVKYGNRGDLSRIFLKGIYRNIMLIGAVDEDIRIAANNKILLINPGWLDSVEPNIDRYGYRLNEIYQIIECIEILSLDIELFYDFKVDDFTRLIAVSNANKYYAIKNEKDMIEKYKGTLKYNIDTYKYAVYFHYLTIIMGMDEFRDVDYWTAFPSSTGSNHNNIYDIVIRTRYLLNNRSNRELFIRHQPAQKSTFMARDERILQGSKRHLDTIHLNPYYKGKLNGRKICVLDDYVTYGASFECARNLLLKEGVREIILVAIGTFQKEYYREDYDISGDIFDSNYNYQLRNKTPIKGTANEKASEMINYIYDIIV